MNARRWLESSRSSTRNAPWLFVAVPMILGLMVPGLAQDGQTPVGPDGAPAIDSVVSSAVRAHLGAERFTLQALRPVMDESDRLQIPLALGEQDTRLILQAKSVRAPTFRLRVQDAAGRLRETVPPPPCTYRGYAAGVGNSRG